jgi:tetratricopeptide (TPR) repeat protein
MLKSSLFPAVLMRASPLICHTPLQQSRLIFTKPATHFLECEWGHQPRSIFPLIALANMFMKATLLLLTLIFSIISPLAACSSSSPAVAPKPAIEYNDRGTTKYQRGDHQGAIQEFDRAITIAPRYAQAYANRGAAKSGIGDKRGAIADYTQAIAINPQDALTYYNRGVAKFELSDSQGALSDFDRAIAINPQDAETYCNRGSVKLATGNKQGGIADLTKCAELFRQQGQTADYQKILDLIRQSK